MVGAENKFFNKMILTHFCRNFLIFHDMINKISLVPTEEAAVFVRCVTGWTVIILYGNEGKVCGTYRKESLNGKGVACN